MDNPRGIDHWFGSFLQSFDNDREIEPAFLGGEAHIESTSSAIDPDPR